MSQGTIAQIHEAKVHEPRGSRGVTTLPCGYLEVASGELYTEVEFQAIRGHEEDMLASETVPNWKKTGLLLVGCTRRIGPVVDPGRLATMVGELLVGDRVALMFAIRAATFGREYPFIDKCPHCRKESMFMLDLSELDVKKMPDPNKRLFEETLDNGLVVRFHPLRGTEEEALSKARSDTEKLSLSILARLDSLNGDQPTLRTVKDLTMPEREALTMLFDSVEGGIETDLELQCPKCGEEYERALDPTQLGFFFPQRALRAWNKKSSSSQSNGTGQPKKYSASR